MTSAPHDRYLPLLQTGKALLLPVPERKGWHVIKERATGIVLYVCGRRLSKRLLRIAQLHHPDAV